MCYSCNIYCKLMNLGCLITLCLILDDELFDELCYVLCYLVYHPILVQVE